MKKTTPEFLLIDVGNTRLKWATARSRGPVHARGEIATKKANSAWVNSAARKFPGRHLVLASVVPKLVPPFRRAFSGRLVEVGATLPGLGLCFHYPKPAEIGADRLAAAVAVHKAEKWPVIVVSCGTATAFTVVDAKGRLCGGAIAPGLQAQLKALLGATAQLPATDLHMPNTALAKSTRDAIRAGVMLNYRGGVKEILAGLLKTLAARPKPNIILTGGDAHLLVNELGHRVKLRPLLVFEGLRMIGLRTRTKMS
jgi:type III pantothenate kinase